MSHKIIAIFIVLIFAVGCLSIVNADDNNTTELEVSEDTVIEDATNYIMPVSISDNVIEFSDGFTGFCLDSAKESITTEDGFTAQATSGDEIQNYVKLAIIEAYKQGCEDNLGQIIASFADGSYKSSDNEVIAAVLDSHETIGDEAVVELEDSIEGTFKFELLTPADGNKSECLAYTVSLKEIASDDTLSAAADENVSEETDDVNDTLTNTTTENQDTETNDSVANTTDEDEKTVNTTTENNETPETIVNETNKTIVNKINTLIVNENNTTIVNTTNIKHINKTTTDQPKKETLEQKLIKTVGNPIFLLIVVIAIAAIAAYAMRRKD